MPSPVFNERTMQSAATTWGPPEPSTEYFPPINDGPTTAWAPPKVAEPMTVNGTISATAVLFVLLLASATVGWIQTGEPDPILGPDGSVIGFDYAIPALAWVGVIVGLGLAILLAFRPHLAKFIGPLYAIAQGFFVGAISRMYETFYDGIVVQAAGATIAVFAVMLFLYRTRVIKVTDRFRRIVITATLGIMLFYGVCLLIRLFAGPEAVSFLGSSSWIGIAFSVFVAGLAAFNLALDFDFIERGTEQKLDKNFEWYAAFGLLVTIVWLYLEILRLLAKLRER